MRLSVADCIALGGLRRERRRFELEQMRSSRHATKFGGFEGFIPSPFPVVQTIPLIP
jgi:hypothetical protein